MNYKQLQILNYKSTWLNILILFSCPSFRVLLSFILAHRWSGNEFLAHLNDNSCQIFHNAHGKFTTGLDAYNQTAMI